MVQRSVCKLATLMIQVQIPVDSGLYVIVDSMYTFRHIVGTGFLLNFWTFCIDNYMILPDL